MLAVPPRLHLPLLPAMLPPLPVAVAVPPGQRGVARGVLPAVVRLLLVVRMRGGGVEVGHVRHADTLLDLVSSTC